MSKDKIDKELLDIFIADAEKDLKSLKKQKRKDYGVKRDPYLFTLPKKYRTYIASANARGISFDMTVEDFDNITSKSCVYCGSEGKIGVNRIDSLSGYTQDNIQPCCYICNLMKHRHSHEVFLKHIKKMYEFLYKI